MDDFDAQGAHIEEFSGEEPLVVEREDLDLDGYVDREGHLKPHQTPAEVAREKDVQAELDARLHEVPGREGELDLDSI